MCTYVDSFIVREDKTCKQEKDKKFFYIHTYVKEMKALSARNVFFGASNGDVDWNEKPSANATIVDNTEHANI